MVNKIEIYVKFYARWSSPYIDFVFFNAIITCMHIGILTWCAHALRAKIVSCVTEAPTTIPYGFIKQRTNVGQCDFGKFMKPVFYYPLVPS